jgi:hypothetical protein
MGTLDGWQRLGLTITAIWLGSIVLFTASEWRAVSGGDGPTVFVVLRDAKTQKEFGQLSINEIRELGELTLEKSRAAQAEPGDAEEAKMLLAANPEPALRYFQIATWIFLPLICFWLCFVGVRWVAAGFRGPDR